MRRGNERGEKLKFELSDLTKSPKEIVSEVLNSGKSQLLIPPQYSGDQIQISELNSDEKSIGLFSSGSTDNPKCIWNTYKKLILNARYSAKAFGITSEHRILILAKPWHVAGLSWVMMAEDLECEYKFITTNKGESEKWFNVIQSFKPDFLLTVPPVFRLIYEKDWFAKNIITGGIPLKQNDFKSLEKHCEVVLQGYGQTESGGLIACHKHLTSESAKENEHQNCGNSIDGVELKSVGSPEKPSDIYIKSETAFTKEWFNSGDLGFIKNNEVYLTGRNEKLISEKD